MGVRVLVPGAISVLLAACSTGLPVRPPLTAALDPSCTDAAVVEVKMNRLDGGRLTISVNPDPTGLGKGNHIRWNLASADPDATVEFVGTDGEFGIQAKNLQNAQKLVRASSKTTTFCARADKTHMDAKKRLLYNVVILRSTTGIQPTKGTWICDPTIVNESKDTAAPNPPATISCLAE